MNTPQNRPIWTLHEPRLLEAGLLDCICDENDPDHVCGPCLLQAYYQNLDHPAIQVPRFLAVGTLPGCFCILGLHDYADDTRGVSYFFGENGGLTEWAHLQIPDDLKTAKYCHSWIYFLIEQAGLESLVEEILLRNVDTARRNDDEPL
jgi:hypothetical protein